MPLDEILRLEGGQKLVAQKREAPGAARVPRRRDVGGNFEWRRRPAELSPGGRHFLRAQRGAMGRFSALFVGRTEPDHGAGAYQRRPVGLGPCRVDRLLNLHGVMTVDAADDLPAVCFEARRRVIREPPLDAAVDRNAVVVEQHDQPAEAVVGIANVYHSSQPWPEGTKIKSLRVYQVLPLSVASAAVTHNTGLQIPQGSDSINLARAVLPTEQIEYGWINANALSIIDLAGRKALVTGASSGIGLALTKLIS